jgi:hypothetical protein
MASWFGLRVGVCSQEDRATGELPPQMQAVLIELMGSPVFSRLVPKRGRPKGSVPERTKAVSLPAHPRIRRGWSNQDIAEAFLQDDSVRMKYLLPGPCKYRDVAKDSVGRMIARIRSQIYETGTPLRVRKPFHLKSVECRNARAKSVRTTRLK